jgi:hypothetical protein
MKTLWDTKIWCVLSFLSHSFEFLKKKNTNIEYLLLFLVFFQKFKRVV